MLGEFLLRLAVALPLICGLAALSLYATKRGWLRLPGFMSSGNEPKAGAQSAQLAVLCVKSLSPAARIAVVRFAGRDLLLGLSGQSLTLLAEAGPAAFSDVMLPDAALRPAELREIAS